MLSKHSASKQHTSKTNKSNQDKTILLFLFLFCFLREARLVLISCSSCPSLLTVGITHIYHQVLLTYILKITGIMEPEYILVVKSVLSGLKDLGSIPRAPNINKTLENHQK